MANITYEKIEHSDGCISFTVVRKSGDFCIALFYHKHYQEWQGFVRKGIEKIDL